jgi:DNA-binding NarL/FixJ family response regulator
LLVAATTTDLMDRSRIGAAIPGVVFGLDNGADVVIVDLARGAEQVKEVRAAAPKARVVCYGPHVDDEAAAAARAAGADVVLARSRFFRDPAGAVGLDAG